MYYFKIFYALNLLHILKLILNLLQHVSVPLDHHQEARRSYPKVTTDRFVSALHCGSAAACCYLHQCIILKSFTL
jgi:hypothetical protein